VTTTLRSRLPGEDMHEQGDWARDAERFRRNHCAPAAKTTCHRRRRHQGQGEFPSASIEKQRPRPGEFRLCFEPRAPDGDVQRRSAGELAIDGSSEKEGHAKAAASTTFISFFSPRRNSNAGIVVMLVTGKMTEVTRTCPVALQLYCIFLLL